MSLGGPVTANGTLVIIVCRAKHLPNRRKLDKQSPYVTLRMGSTAKKTPSHFRAGQTPDWTHEIRFELTRDRKPLVRLDVLDETKNDPTPIGTCEIDCSTVFGGENESDGKYIYDRWYDLTLNGRRAGMIYLEMTFYPSSPVLPPKLYENENMGLQMGLYLGLSQSLRDRELPPPPPAHPSKSRQPSVVDDIFVTEDQAKLKRLSLLKNLGSNSFNNSRGSQANEEGNEDVFIQGDEDSPGGGNKNFKQKYYSKFSKFKNKFQNKEPISNLWNFEEKYKTELSHKPIAPINPEEFGSFDDLDNDSLHEVEGNRIGFGESRSSNQRSNNNSNNNSNNHNHNNSNNNDLGITFQQAPPSPPQHQMFPKTPNTSFSNGNPLSPLNSPKAAKSPLRKPPPNFNKDYNEVKMSPKANTTAVPFSADTIGIEDTEDKLPTQVYFMDKPVKSLSHASLPNAPDPVKMDEIDPKYYAPTPNQHYGKAIHLGGRHLNRDDLSIDLRTPETGYLGEGKWKQLSQHSQHSQKFSPSIFDRVPANDENSGPENKPHVPPKIPQGLTEMEYYVLEKEKYLNDINGNRI